MLKTVGGVVLLLLVGCASWSTRDTVLEGVFAATMAVDAVQTVGFAERGAETNFMLGARPSAAWTATYFVTATALHAAIAAALPDKWRTAWQLTFTATQGYQVVRNATMESPSQPNEAPVLPVVVIPAIRGYSPSSIRR